MIYESSCYYRGERATVQPSLHCLPSMAIFINTIQQHTIGAMRTWAPTQCHRHNQTYCEMSRKHKCVTIDGAAMGPVNM